VQSISPPIDRAVLEWHSRSMWIPATFHGRPVEVDYIFNTQFRRREPLGPALDAGQSN